MEESHKYNAELKEVRHRAVLLYDLQKLQKLAKLIYVVESRASFNYWGEAI